MPSQPPATVSFPAAWAASWASHSAPMELASSTFLARPRVNRRAPRAKSSAVFTRWRSPAATVLYWTMGPAIS